MTTNALDKITSTGGAAGNNFSNYLSGVSNMIQPITSDIMGVYNAYNPKIQTPLINNTNVANYNELANLGPAYMDMSGFKKKSAQNIFLDSQFLGAAEGAMAGSSLGPWGMLGGAIGGNLMHLAAGIVHNTVGQRNYKQQVDSFNTRQLQNFNQNLNSSYDRLNYDYMKNQKVNYAAFGGNLFTQNSGPFTEINNGGSHEENPYGGIPQGVGSNGKQNLVEQGEVKYNNFVFSKRVYPTKEVLAQFKIPVKYFGLSAADIAKKFNIEAKERPSDPISNTGQDTMLNRLQQAQEYQKVVNEAEKNGMTPEQYMQTIQQQPQEQEQQNSFAYGGLMDSNIFSGGGPKDPPVVADATRVQTNNIPYNHPVNQKYAAEAFIQEYIKQIAYLSPAQIAEFNKTLNAAEMAVVKQLPQDALYEAKNRYLDSQVGTITPGKNYNAAQDWWRDFTQTQKGQEIVKFINNPIVNQAAVIASGGAALGLMGAGWANDYGQGASIGEVANNAAFDLGTMLVVGRILNGKAITPLSNEMGFMGNQMKRQVSRGVQTQPRYNMAQNKQPVFTPNKPVIDTRQSVPQMTTRGNNSLGASPEPRVAKGPRTYETETIPPIQTGGSATVTTQAVPKPETFGNPLFEGPNKTGYANWLEKNQPVPKYLRSPFGKGKSSPIPKDINYSKRIANTFTAAVPIGVSLGFGIDNNKQQATFNWIQENRVYALHLIEDKIAQAKYAKDYAAMEQAVTEWKEAVDTYQIPNYKVDMSTGVGMALFEIGYVSKDGSVLSKSTQTSSQNTNNMSNTLKTNQSQPFIPPILKNHKVVKVEGNETTFDNGVIVFTTDNGNYVLNHTISKGTRQTIYNSNNELLSDDWYDSNDKYLGTHEEVVKSWTNQTKPTKATQNNNTSNGGQSYSGGTQKSLNYTPIDYNSDLGKQYMQRYNSVGNDWNRLWTDWKQANPNSTYSLEQFKALAHDNKYGPVHEFIKGYNEPVQQPTVTTENSSINNTTDLSGMNAAPGWDDLPDENTTPSTTNETQSNNWDKFREAATFFNPARLAPLFNDIYNLANQEGADPTLANSIRGAYTPIQIEQFGQAMAYDPYDWRANEIAQRAKAQSAQQAMMNIAGGNTAAATANLALQNAINQGDIAANYRQGIEYNNANRANVLNFNNQLDQANSMNRQQVNQYNNTNYMNSIVNSAQVWDQEKKLIEQTRGQNQNMFAQNLGGLGQDYVSYNMIQNNPYLLYSMFGRYKGQN